MNQPEVTGRRTACFVFLMVLLASFPSLSRAQSLDPNLRLGITRTNQSVVLNWFASNAIPYQVESSPSLINWTNSSLVVTGKGGFLFLTNPAAPPGRGFFRVKRLIPDAISAEFDPITGTLTIVGDDYDNIITVSRKAAGALLINGGSVVVRGGTPTVANTTLIQIFGRDGNDQLTLNEERSQRSFAQGQHTRRGRQRHCHRRIRWRHAPWWSRRRHPAGEGRIRHALRRG
jgi:hypothetical protein